MGTYCQISPYLQLLHPKIQIHRLHTSCKPLRLLDHYFAKQQIVHLHLAPKR